GDPSWIFMCSRQEFQTQRAINIVAPIDKLGPNWQYLIWLRCISINAKGGSHVSDAVFICKKKDTCGKSRFYGRKTNHSGIRSCIYIADNAGPGDKYF